MAITPTLDELWSLALGHIQDEISQANFTTWFKHTHIEKKEKGCVTIGVPNPFVKDWLYTKYHRMILRILRDLGHGVRQVEYVVTKRASSASKTSPVKKATPKKKDPLVIQEQKKKEEAKVELPLKDLYVNKKTNLNPRYTFSSFVIGSFNELAYSAAHAIVKKPATYNPLYIYGETGLGKTHLIQAVGNTLSDSNPNLRIYYTTTERFTMDYIASIQRNTPTAFKEKYRSCDVLIMDDIQFLAGKEKTQEELFHLFNTLYNENKQIIFSSDKHPNYITGLESRLQSRFAAGMVIEVVRPEYESRVAILNNKLQTLDYEMDTKHIEYIAEHVEGNIRELEGILNTLNAHADLFKRPLTFDEIRNAIKKNVKQKKRRTPGEIAGVVAKYYDVEKEKLFGKTRQKEVVHARQVAMYVLREDMDISFPHIGREFGGRDHSTVIHAHKKITEDLETNTSLIHDIEQIRSMIQTL